MQHDVPVRNQIELSAERVAVRGALLLGADLRQADLREADMIGADLRAAKLCGADLRGSLFLTQAQLNAASGDANTRLPHHLTRPAHWNAEKK